MKSILLVIVSIVMLLFTYVGITSPNFGFDSFNVSANYGAFAPNSTAEVIGSNLMNLSIYLLTVYTIYATYKHFTKNK